jgi:hypothetical protein
MMVDRHCPFDWLFRQLPEKPVIVETGTARAHEDFAGAGMSTLLFGVYAAGKSGKVISVDISPANCQFSRALTTGLPVEVVEAHSHDFFRGYSGPPIDLY